MKGHYSDPTANKAIGSIDREIEIMRKRADRIRERKLQGRLTQQELDRARREFVGIHRRLLVEALAA